MPGARTWVVDRWPLTAPVLSLVTLALTWGRDLPSVVVAVAAVVLAAAVLAAVHHAEVIAHRVGEPFGSLVLAVAVTVIDVALIVTLTATGGDKASSLARDTVFAAIMITCNGIVGVCLVASTLRTGIVRFNAEGAGGALAALAALATLSLVLPTFTTSTPGPTFSTTQLTFAAVSSLALYALFVFVQTVRHRDFFLVDDEAHGHAAGGHATTADERPHAEPPSDRETRWSVALLLVALVAVVGLAKVLSPTIEDAVEAADLPVSFVGVVIALLVLLPESVAALRNARRGQIQTSYNLAYGSAMASIGLTIPAIAIASIWLSGPLDLGLGPREIVLLAITVVVSALTVAPGRATLLQGGVHVVLFSAFLVLAVSQ